MGSVKPATPAQQKCWDAMSPMDQARFRTMPLAWQTVLLAALAGELEPPKATSPSVHQDWYTCCERRFLRQRDELAGRGIAVLRVHYNGCCTADCASPGALGDEPTLTVLKQRDALQNPGLFHVDVMPGFLPGGTAWVGETRPDLAALAEGLQAATLDDGHALLEMTREDHRVASVTKGIEGPGPAAIISPSGIPKLLTIVWVGPHAPPVECIESWEKKHINGWRFRIWTSHTEIASGQPFRNQDMIDKLAARTTWNGVADVIRYELLVRDGGFIVDADSLCLRALDEGPERFLESKTAVACYENEIARPGMVGCGFLGAPPGNKFFERCVTEIVGADIAQQAWKIVGPGLMTRVRNALPDEIVVYPAILFNPTHFTGQKAPGTAEPYADQKWGGTKGYNFLRKLPCPCRACSHSMLYR